MNCITDSKQGVIALCMLLIPYFKQEIDSGILCQVERKYNRN